MSSGEKKIHHNTSASVSHNPENFATLALRCRQGLQHCTRCKDWRKLLGDESFYGCCKEEREFRKKRYHELLKSRSRLDGDFNVVETDSPTIIDYDVARTKQYHSFFAGGKNYSSPAESSCFNMAQQALRRVLSTACWEDPGGMPPKEAFRKSLHSLSSSPGTSPLSLRKQSTKASPRVSSLCIPLAYVQGMNEIAAVLLYAFCGGKIANLTDKVETDVFWCFRILMYSANPSTYMEKTEQFTLFLKYIDLKLYSHVQNLDPSIFSCVGTRWMAVLFSQNFSLDDCLQIWDFLFSFGYLFSRASVYIGCGICISLKEELMIEKDITVVLKILNSMFSSATVGPILKTTKELMVQYPFHIFEKHVLKALSSPVSRKSLLFP